MSGEQPGVIDMMTMIHVMFLAAVEAGFTEYQALVMMGAFMAASGSGPGNAVKSPEVDN